MSQGPRRGAPIKEANGSKSRGLIGRKGTTEEERFEQALTQISRVQKNAKWMMKRERQS